MTLPDGFIKMLDGLGPEYSALADTLTDSAPEVAVRLNRAKLDRHGLSSLPVTEGAAPVAWCADGFVLKARPAFTLDPALHQGLYYVQDASSMAVGAAVRLAAAIIGEKNRPLRFLDACAAPGGKTTAAIAALPPETFVVANEFDPRRAAVLSENLSKWGRSAIVTTGNAAEPWRLPGFFDIIAADVPCSGEGMMRKEPQAVAQWSPGLVESCASLQAEIVASLWDALTPGGVMIYSTCTFNPVENEEIVARLIDFCDAEPLRIPELETDGVLGAHPGYMFPVYHFLPGLVPGEGQFVAMVRKPLITSGGETRLPRVQQQTVRVPEYLDGDYVYSQDKDGRITALPAAHRALAAAVAATRRVRQAGIEIGTMKGRDIIPAQPLASAIDLRHNAFPTAAVDLDTALAYLRRQSVTLPEATPRGHTVLTYGGAPLGFVKNLGNRTNNLYPAPWRILH
ncbi:MAG: RNA methyltransferase RsmF [Muribaculaceae bacterium]|nr:RNA methyltransferase RsmF [Muribaculaceae bacterium]